MKSTKSAKSATAETTVIIAPESLPANDLSAVTTESLLAELTSRLKLPNGAAEKGLRWAKTASVARAEIGKIKARCTAGADSTHSLRDKRKTLIEGVSYDVSGLPEKDVKELAKLTTLLKAAERLDAAK